MSQCRSRTACESSCAKHTLLDITAAYREYFFVVVLCQGPGTAQIGEGGDNSWIVLDEDDDEDEKMEDNDEIEKPGVQKNPETATQSPQQKNGSKGEKYNNV